MKPVITSKRFERDLKKMLKRGKDPQKLFAIVEALATNQALESKHVPHPLTGNWKPYWDCHIEPDWILIYIVTETSVDLIRTGTHADLF